MTVEGGPQEMRQRHFHVAPWEITFGCGVVKLAIAIAALAWPLLRSNPIPSVVGWMLVLGGAAELLLSWSGRNSWIGRLTLGSGAVTIIAGALFLNSEWTGLFPLTQCLVLWLLVRGILSIDVAVASWNTPTANWGWLLLRGIVDFGLGWLLSLGAIMAMMVWLFFGETREVTASFFFVLAVSFAVAGAGLIAISLTQRRLRFATPFLAGSDERQT